jgi:type II secretory pathway predicted ATPase ExeA/cell division septation protein DedD
MYSANDRSPRPLQDASASRGGASSSLTYEPFYGLREKPFSLSADPRFLFRSPAHGPAFDELQAGIHRREGLIVLTGEIGTGKTTLCRSVLDHLDRRTFASFVADPFVSREDLLKTLLVDFGVISIGDLTRGRFNGASRSDLSYPLYEFLDSLVPLQAFAVLVIDEAQNLSLPLLEEIRILSELERREKLLQVVLVGQPELRSSLRLPEMRQVDQRVSVRCELTALDAAGVAGYVTYRLRVAGRGESRVEFTRRALEAIYEGSTGVPRLINRICDRTLQRAFGSRAIQIDAEFVWMAIDDLGLSAPVAIQERTSPEVPSKAAAPVSVGEPAAAPAAIAVPEIPAPAIPAPAIPAPAATIPAAAIATAINPVPEIALGELTAFNAESDLPLIERSRTRRRWLTGAAAAAIGVSASVGAAAWYSGAQPVDAGAVAAMLPPRPAHTLSQPANVLPPVPPLVPQSMNPAAAPANAASADAAGNAATAAPRTNARPASTVAPAARAYTIVVASFTNRDRAEGLAEDLTNAGYGARTVERDGGPGRGRFVQVLVSGYTSAIDVQRDLQRIRALPGGYSDARIVERD